MDVPAEDDIHVEDLVFLNAWMVMLAGYYMIMRHRQAHRPRRFWVRPINQTRHERGHFFTLFQEMKITDPEQFFVYTRMSRRQFGILLRKVTPLLRKRSHRAVCPEERLALTLKYLAQGTSMQNIMWEYCLGKSTISCIIRETCNAIWTVLHNDHLPGPDEDKWKTIATEFLEKWNMPNCLGAIDGKHITIQCPQRGGTQFFNYKKTHSTILMAACDAFCRFTMVDIGGYGSQGDLAIFRASDFGRAILEENLDVPANAKLPNTDQETPHYFVADEAFPIRPNIMRPYPGRLLDEPKKIFNYRLSRARRTIENAFGILSSRWRIFLRPIIASVETVDSIVKATVCLHNFLKSDEHLLPAQHRRYCPQHFIDHEDVDGNVIDGGWRADIRNFGAVRNVGRVGANNGGFEAVNVRSILTEYFVTPQGEVPWQYEMINRGYAPN